MVYASKPEIFGDGHADSVTVTIPVSYARLCVCCLVAQDVIWMDGDYGATTITDSERDELDTAVSDITAALDAL